MKSQTHNWFGRSARNWRFTRSGARGADLQDLYGVNTPTIVKAGRLQNGYFQGGTANELMTTLGSTPDGLLVSAETVHDFQLLPGDAITLRLQNGKTKQYVDVPFHYVGVAKEFPTAPHDSFLLANASYIAKMTGSDTVGVFPTVSLPVILAM